MDWNRQFLDFDIPKGKITFSRENNFLVVRLSGKIFLKFDMYRYDDNVSKGINLNIYDKFLNITSDRNLGEFEVDINENYNLYEIETIRDDSFDFHSVNINIYDENKDRILGNFSFYHYSFNNYNLIIKDEEEIFNMLF